MGASMTSVSNITKEIYGTRIVDQMENEITLTKRIEKTSKGTEEHVGGKYVTFPLKVRRNHGIGYRNELEQLQAPGQQGWASIRVPLKYGYGRVHMSGQTFDLAETNYQAFSSAMREEMDGLKTDLVKDTNRILWGNGLGVISTVTAATGPLNTVTVGAGGLNFIELDMMIDVLSSDGITPKVQNRKITLINETTGVITFDGAAGTFVIGDILVRTGDYGKEPQGLTSLVAASGTLFNLSPTTEPLWKSTEDNAGGALSESRMIAMCDNLRAKGGRPTAIFTDLGTRRAYFNLLTTQRRFTGTKTFDGGFTGMTFSYDEDIPVITDVDAPAGKMWFINEPSLTVYQVRDWGWEDRDGSTWKWVTNYDAYEALMKKYWEFAVNRRNLHGVMTGITSG